MGVRESDREKMRNRVGEEVTRREEGEGERWLRNRGKKKDRGQRQI